MVKFTFNKKAQRTALAALRKLEAGSFASAVLGAFSASPKMTALVALALFVLCRVCETVITGIENDDDETKPAQPDAPNDPVPPSTNDRDGDGG